MERRPPNVGGLLWTVLWMLDVSAMVPIQLQLQFLFMLSKPVRKVLIGLKSRPERGAGRPLPARGRAECLRMRN